MKKHSLIALAGFIWFSIGLALLGKGLHLLLSLSFVSGKKTGPLLNALMYAFTGALVPSLLFIVVLGLLLGMIKGRWALARSARRTIARIAPMQGHIKLTKLYRIHDYLLVIGMIGLGRLMHWMQLPSDLHGLLDVTIGSALVNGAMIYFRYAIKMREVHL